MEANFSEIADRFQQIIQKMRKEEPCLLAQPQIVRTVQKRAQVGNIEV